MKTTSLTLHWKLQDGAEILSGGAEQGHREAVFCFSAQNRLDPFSGRQLRNGDPAKPLVGVSVSVLKRGSVVPEHERLQQQGG